MTVKTSVTGSATPSAIAFTDGESPTSVLTLCSDGAGVVWLSSMTTTTLGASVGASLTATTAGTCALGGGVIQRTAACHDICVALVGSESSGAGHCGVSPLCEVPLLQILHIAIVKIAPSWTRCLSLCASTRRSDPCHCD